MKTNREVIKQIGASWAHELKTQSLMHICKQAIHTLYLLPTLLFVMLYVRVRRLFVIGYSYARHYFFLCLYNLKIWTGLYIDERPNRQP